MRAGRGADRTSQIVKQLEQHTLQPTRAGRKPAGFQKSVHCRLPPAPHPTPLAPAPGLGHSANNTHPRDQPVQAQKTLLAPREPAEGRPHGCRMQGWPALFAGRSPLPKRQRLTSCCPLGKPRAQRSAHAAVAARPLPNNLSFSPAPHIPASLDPMPWHAIAVLNIMSYL